MPRISSNFLRHELVRTFVFDSGANVPVGLDVTLAYTPAEKLSDEEQKQSRRVIGNRRFSEFEDLESKQRAIERMTALVLSSTIRKIDGLTARKLDALIGLDNYDGVDLDAPIELDPSDTTPLTEEELASISKDDEMRDVKTKGGLASLNITDLIARCPRFRNWITAVVSDVSYFTAKNYDELRKN